jgi:spermidine synthase
MRFAPRYRTVVYAGTLATGFAGLIYQVVWQKYLTFIVGSDSRSVALVVATFLAGLAAGYRYWGRRTERYTERRAVLRLYGMLELGIGLYAALFLPWFSLVRQVAYHGPAWLVTDLFVCGLTLLPPTFLMGATIPLLVRALPDRPDEVNLCHARIYGINTLGACLGAFGASLVLIPRLGLPATLGLAAALNLLVGTLFVMNPLRGTIREHEPIAAIPNRLGVPTIYLYTLVTGTVALSLEVLCVRLLHLSIGAGPHNFALVVGVFIFGLALGSLGVTSRMLSVRALLFALSGTVAYLVALYFTVPYWPYWLSNLRALLPLEPSSYDLIQLQVLGFLSVALLPFLVALGSMLPLAYALLPKDTSDYGKKCGWLYFYNTLGTAFGAVGLSYLALRWLDLDQLFKLDVLLLVGLLLLLATRERWRRLALVAAVVGLAFLVAPRWNRGAHHVGLFHYQGTQPFNFKGLFSIPITFPDILFFKDGPDATITVARRDVAGGEDRAVPAMALLNNGRGEADSLLDYSTMTLPAALPYLFAPDRSDLDVVLVGLGSGTTAGLLASGRDVRHLTVAEISTTLIEAVPLFDALNHGLLSNPKAQILSTDGFKYFAKARRPVDIVVSVPSVPWVQGVENLFTPEYYQLIRQTLANDGVFMQWFPLYTVDATLFRSILRNLLQVFPEVAQFQISRSEMGLLASTRPLRGIVSRRMAEPTMAQACAHMGWIDPNQLILIQGFTSRELRFLSETGPAPVHTLTRPSLSYASDRIRYLPQVIDWNAYLDPRLARIRPHAHDRALAFTRLLAVLPATRTCDASHSGTELFCARFDGLRTEWDTFNNTARPPVERVRAYDNLRQEDLVPPDPAFLHAATRALITATDDPLEAAQTILVVYAKEGLFDDARLDIGVLAEASRLSDATRATWLAELEQGQRARAEFVAAYEGASK